MLQKSILRKSYLLEYSTSKKICVNKKLQLSPCEYPEKIIAVRIENFGKQKRMPSG